MELNAPGGCALPEQAGRSLLLWHSGLHERTETSTVVGGSTLLVGGSCRELAPL